MPYGGIYLSTDRSNVVLSPKYLVCLLSWGNALRAGLVNPPPVGDLGLRGHLIRERRLGAGLGYRRATATTAAVSWVVFTLGRCFYPTTSELPMSVLNLRPREIQNCV